MLVPRSSPAPQPSRLMNDPTISNSGESTNFAVQHGEGCGPQSPTSSYPARRNSFRQVLPTNEAESHTQRSQYHEDYTEDDGATEDEVEMAEDEEDIGGNEEDLSFAEMDPPTDFFNSAFDAGIYDSVYHDIS